MIFDDIQTKWRFLGRRSPNHILIFPANHVWLPEGILDHGLEMFRVCSQQNWFGAVQRGYGLCRAVQSEWNWWRVELWWNGDLLSWKFGACRIWVWSAPVIGKMKFVHFPTTEHPFRMQIKANSRTSSTTLFTRKFGLEFDQRMFRVRFVCHSFDLPRPSTTHALGVGVWTIAQCWASRMIWPCAATDRGRATVAHHAESWQITTRLYWDSNLGLGRCSNAAFFCVWNTLKYICIVSMVTRCNKFIGSVRTFLLCLLCLHTEQFPRSIDPRNGCWKSTSGAFSQRQNHILVGTMLAAVVRGCESMLVVHYKAPFFDPFTASLPGPTTPIQKFVESESLWGLFNHLISHHWNEVGLRKTFGACICDLAAHRAWVNLNPQE